jgi:uncharacterized protein
VTDQAGILDADTVGAITTRLIDLQRDTGSEVVVVTLTSLQGASIETWGNALAESWYVGRSGAKDTGVLLIVAPNDRKVRIAVGYGLGNQIPDAVAAMIISDHILPYFRQGNFARGVKAGIDSIALELDRPSGSTAAPASTDVERSAAPVSVYRPGFWEWLRTKLGLGHDTKTITIWIVIFAVVFVWMVLNVSNVGSGRRRRRSDDGYYDNDYDDDSSSNGWFSGSGGSSSSSSSSSGGSSGGGATGSW